MSNKTIVLVGCGSAKTDEPRPARELYTSTYFAKKRRYAELVGDRWAVLSAEHMILHPGHETEPYDTSMDDVEDLGEWADGVMGGLYAMVDVVRAEHLMESVSIELEILAGQDYVEPLRSRFSSMRWTVRYPFDETCGIGEQHQWLTEQLEERGADE